ncbi:MAG: hypothetical protein M3R51_02900 [Candidatus Eremiobacteraeota bacterium]|nr:hypothetical protein [Candidatus Eremiobacteraeota bacterium]
MWRLFQRFIAVSPVLVLAACGMGSSPGNTSSPTPGPTRTPLASPVVAGSFLPPAGTRYFGAYVNSTGLVGGNTPADTAQLEAQLNRPLALHMQYEQFTANFSGRALQDDFANYRVPIVSLNCGAPNSQIANGTYDATLQLKALEAKNFGWPVFVRYMWDVNLPSTLLGRSGSNNCWSDPAQGGTDLPNHVFSPTQFIAAWQHIRTIFAQAGATNVIWLWTVSSSPLGTSNFLQYYPGASQVDWVGMDAYDTANGDFASTFAPTYAQLATLNKPVMISETGAQAPQQNAFFSNAVPTMNAQFPLVKAFVYYDAIDYVTGQNQDWRVTSSSFPAFISFANDPSMAAKYVGP